MKKFIFLLYGVLAYLFFLAAFTYLIGFTGNILVPKGIDGVAETPLVQAILINLGLILLFGVQHSVMARQWFKDWMAKFMPRELERSTFVLFSSLALMVMFALWQPFGGTIWTISNPIAIGVIYVLFALGWALVLLSSFQINHFDLFGLRQVWLYVRGQAYTDLPFQIPFLYRYVRHPLYMGILLAFWAAPTMSVSRLFFALLFTFYVVRAIQWEENDLIRAFGDRYRSYRERIPMLVPIRFKRKPTEKQPNLEPVPERKA